MSGEHDAVRDLLAPAALGAAGAAELARVEDHAARCAVCSEELAGLRAAAGAMGSSLPAVQPPPALKSRLMAQVRAEAPAGAPAPLRRRRRRPFEWITPRAAWPALTGSLAAAALILFGLNLAARSPAPSQLTSISVRGTAAAADLRGQVIVLRDRDVAVVRLQRLRPAGRGRGYELWAIRDGKPVSAGFLAQRGPGEGILAATDLAGVESLAVTREPVTNRSAPTSEPVMVVPLPPQG
ncbi:MAG: hypothetical protein QOK40_2963 [Miltoncostaeaceae bacterium]|jgi:hypothetical protein|nr:hypothetical protein [Miltoncostaeaceae bacterium]